MIKLRYIIFLVAFRCLLPDVLFSQTLSLDSLSNALDTAKGQSRVHIYNSICLNCRFSDPAKAMKAGTEGLALAKKINSKSQQVYLRNNIGLLLMDKGQYEKALNNFIAVAKLADSISHKEGLAMSLQNSGIIYQYQHHQ